MTETKKYKHMGLCKHCYDRFFAQREDKRYCSHTCRQKAYIERLKSPFVVIVAVKPKTGLAFRLAMFIQKIVSFPF
jgi:hypothetical protein